MIETARYIRKPFEVDAVQVTAENIAQVASWCGGEVRTSDNSKRGGKTQDAKYVKLHVHMPANDRQTRAYVGDWVLFGGTGYRAYTTKAFTRSFEQLGLATTSHPTALDHVADAAVPVLMVEAGSLGPLDVGTTH